MEKEYPRSNRDFADDFSPTPANRPLIAREESSF